MSREEVGTGYDGYFLDELIVELLFVWRVLDACNALNVVNVTPAMNEG